LLRCVADGRAQLHHHHARSAGPRHEHVAAAAHLLDLVRHRHPRPARLRRPPGRRHPAAHGPQPRHQLLRARRPRRQRRADQTPGRLASAVAAPVLVLGHPEVYIAILPGMGVASQLLSTFARKPIFGYRAMVYAIIGIGLLGFMVWGHHMFMSGMSPYSAFTFSLMTMAIGVPSAIKTFNWLGTLYRSRIRFAVPMLFALGFVSLFVTGGLSGPFLAQPSIDNYLHDTYFVVAHFHLIMGVAAIFGIFAGTYYWFPKMFGRMMNDTLGKVHFWISFIGTYAIFMPMHYLGMAGHPRRYSQLIFDYLQPLKPVQGFITIA